MRLTVPVKIFSPRSMNSRSSISRSASRMRCSTTCLAVMAPIRPIGTDSTCSSMKSPTAISAMRSSASISSSSASGFCRPASLGTTSQRRKVSYSPLSRSMATRMSTSPLYSFLVAWASAISMAPNTTSRSTFFSRAIASTSINSSRFIVVYSVSCASFSGRGCSCAGLAAAGLRRPLKSTTGAKRASRTSSSTKPRACSGGGAFFLLTR